MSKVCITRCGNDITSDISNTIEAVCSLSELAGKTIIIKVNACRPGYAPGQVTSPEFLRVVLTLLRTQARSIIVCESNGQRFSATESLERAGLAAVARQEGAQVVNLSQEPTVSVPVPEPLYFKTVDLPKPLVEADIFIDMCCMKTHKLTGVTLGLKNMFGCLPIYDRCLLHSHINELLADVASVLRPRISLMDAVVAMEGDGPIAGIPKRMNLILASDNVAALDFTAAQIMGFDPQRVLHIANAVKKMPIEPLEIIGPSVKEVTVPFKKPAYDFISKIEREVQKNPFLARMVYLNPKIFSILKWLGWKIRDVTGYTKRYQKDLENCGESVGLYDVISSRTGD